MITIAEEIRCPSVTDRILFERNAKINILGIIPKLVPIKNDANLTGEAPAAMLTSMNGPLGSNRTIKLL